MACQAQTVEQNIAPKSTAATRHSRGLLWLLAGLFVALCLAYAAVIPILEGFDVQSHFAAINYYRTERRLPAITPETLARSYEVIVHPPFYYVLSALASAAWPIEPAADAAIESINPYFAKIMTYRQSETLPDLQLGVLAPAWVARLVSIVGGMITVLCTWWLARRLFPGAPLFWAAATAVVAFNPQFLFMAVSISTDAWATATCALTLTVAVDLYCRRRPATAWIWAGAGLGLAALTKYSALLLGVPLGILWLLYWRQMGWRIALRGGLLAALAFVLVAGWWFARNLWLYGELIPFQRMHAVIGSLYRPEPFSMAQTLDYAPWLRASFWGVFVALIAPALYLEITRWFMWLGLFGLPLALYHLRRAQRETLELLAFVLVPWLAVVALSVFYWTRTIDYGEQGRLAHIGAPAFGVVVAASWQAWFPQRWRTAVQIALVAFMLALAIGLLPFLYTSYRVPPALAQAPVPDRAVAAQFEGGMRLAGADFPDGAALVPGRPLPVTLYFTTDSPIDEDYTLFLHLADDQDRLLYQLDTVPEQGRHATRQWVPGEVFADHYQIVVDKAAGDGLATLSLGFYPVGDTAARRTVYDNQGQAIGDRLVLAQIRLHTSPAAPPAPVAPVAPTVWQNGIALLDAEVHEDNARLPTGVTLTWTTTATLQQDYTVFLQVLDAGNQILAQVDRPPQAGRYPTSTWRAGDVITDTLEWSGAVATWQRIIVGLYDGSGRRLLLAPPNASPADAYVLSERIP